MKVFITRIIPPIAEEMLRNEGFKVAYYNRDTSIPRDELIQYGKEADALITLLSDKIDEFVIDELTNCKIISNYAVGYNNINVEYAKLKNIVVTNTPDILTDATADLTFALILACARRIVESDYYVRKGLFDGWKPQLMLGFELKGKTLGIIGAGRIGQAVAERAMGFGMNIMYNSRKAKPDFESRTGAEKVELDLLLEESDFVSLHVPLTAETNNLLSREKLNIMKPNAVLINTSRGEVIDEKELIRLLSLNKFFAAGLDVYQNEPNIKKEFLSLDNVILLPHIGSATVEARTGMAELAARNVINVLKGNNPVTPV